MDLFTGEADTHEELKKGHLEEEHNYSVSIYSDMWNIGVIAFALKFKEFPLMNEVM